MAQDNPKEKPQDANPAGIMTFFQVQEIFNKYGIQFNGETIENSKLCSVIKHLENKVEDLESKLRNQ